MREIKFRAWDKFFKKMKYGSPMAILYLNDVDHEIMQFTGLKDETGKEIYEGDIIKYFYADYKDPCIIPVQFRAPGFDIPVETEVEIIGNIYEHPDLLPK